MRNTCSGRRVRSLKKDGKKARKQPLVQAIWRLISAVNIPVRVCSFFPRDRNASVVLASNHTVRDRVDHRGRARPASCLVCAVRNDSQHSSIIACDRGCGIGSVCLLHRQTLPEHQSWLLLVARKHSTGAACNTFICFRRQTDHSNRLGPYNGRNFSIFWVVVPTCIEEVIRRHLVPAVVCRNLLLMNCWYTQVDFLEKSTK